MWNGNQFSSCCPIKCATYICRSLDRSLCAWEQFCIILEISVSVFLFRFRLVSVELRYILCVCLVFVSFLFVFLLHLVHFGGGMLSLLNRRALPKSIWRFSLQKFWMLLLLLYFGCSCCSCCCRRCCCCGCSCCSCSCCCCCYCCWVAFDILGSNRLILPSFPLVRRRRQLGRVCHSGTV